MCGIVGEINKNEVKKENVRKMNDCIIHRGPDSYGEFFDEKVGLAMRRLKIIDLSTGDQPLFNETKDILVFFNGEIYNYQTLREELIIYGHKFTTHSDTEVLVHGFEVWGIEGLLNKLEGMFVFSIYDKPNNKLFIARDRFGEKPLYYYSDKSTFIFASELKALLSYKNIKKEIDPTALYYQLAVHFVPEERTLIKNIFKLPPSCYLELDTNTLAYEIKRYWYIRKLKFDSRIRMTDAIEIIRNMLEESIRLRMIADVPVGAFLSGGLDSSVMVMLMNENTSDLKTFSIGFEKAGFDESDYAKEVSRRYKTDHHHFIFTEKNILGMFDDLIDFVDEPIGDQAMIPVLLLSREASKHVKVVLSGEGADEIFGGYTYYEQFTRDFSYPSNAFLQEAFYQTISGFPLISDKSTRLKLINQNFYNKIEFDLNFDKLYVEKHEEIFKDSFTKAQLGDCLTWLPDDLLIKFDRMGMAASIEGRAPFLDSRLAEYSINLPTNLKWNGSVSKLILREAFKDKLPYNISNREKHGFNLPMSEWFRGKLKDKLLESAEIYQDDLINNFFYKRLIKHHLDGTQDNTRLLYTILVYKLWFQKFVK